MGVTTCFSFKKGFRQLPAEKSEEVKEAIMTTLKIKARMAWHNRLNGLVEPRKSEAEKIEGIFAGYGITEVWGE